MKIELLLLAAGESKRFKGVKQLAQVNGTTMLCHCLAQYRTKAGWLSGIENGYVVLGANVDLIEPSLPSFINRKYVNNWYKGMGTSLATSMSVVAKDTSHLLVGLGDQVALSSEHISQLIQKAKAHPQNIVASHYLGIFGVPAIFPRQYFPNLQMLTGDRGAKELLNSKNDGISSVPLKSAEIDIDTQTELKNFLTRVRQ